GSGWSRGARRGGVNRARRWRASIGVDIFRRIMLGRIGAVDAAEDVIVRIRPEGVVRVRPEDVIETIVIGVGPEHRTDKTEHESEEEMIMVVSPTPVLPPIRLSEIAAEGRLRQRSRCRIAR